MINKTIFTTLFILLSNSSFAQKLFDDYKTVVENNQKYLQDEQGKKYLLAEQIAELSPTSEALVLKDSLTVFPEEILNFPNLKVLIVKGNRFKFLPERLDKLVNLEVLDVSQNRLVVLPKGLSKLVHLKKLDVSDNYYLFSFPKGFGAISGLKAIWANDTKITRFSTRKLIQLEVLEYGSAPLADSILIYLPNLKALYKKNAIPIPPVAFGTDNELPFESFPKSFFKLKNLEILELNCASNSLNINDLCVFKKLKKLNLINYRFPELEEQDNDMKDDEIEKSQAEIDAQNLKDSIMYFNLEQNAIQKIQNCLPNCEVSFSWEEMDIPAVKMSHAFRDPEVSFLKNIEKEYRKNPTKKGTKVQLTGYYCMAVLAQLSINDIDEAGSFLRKAKKTDPTHLDIIKVEPILLLYQDKFEEAKKMILKWKNKPYNSNETFQAAFQAALLKANELEIAPESISKKMIEISEILK